MVPGSGSSEVSVGAVPSPPTDTARIEQQRERRVRLRAMLRAQAEQHDLAGVHVDRHAPRRVPAISSSPFSQPEAITFVFG